MGARYLTVEELDRRHEEARQKLLAKQEAAEKAKAERNSKLASQGKLAMLERFLERHELSLKGGCLPYVDDPAPIEVFWGEECIGTLDGEAAGEPKTEDEAEEARRYEQEQALR